MVPMFIRLAQLDMKADGFVILKDMNILRTKDVYIGKRLKMVTAKSGEYTRSSTWKTRIKLFQMFGEI